MTYRRANRSGRNDRSTVGATVRVPGTSKTRPSEILVTQMIISKYISVTDGPKVGLG